MPRRTFPRQDNAVPDQSGRAERSLRLLRSVALVALLLLPVQMRAGGPEEHPHALLQLLLDARDGRLDHHTVVGDAPHAHDGHSAKSPRSHQEPDAPSFADASGAGGGLSIIAALVVVLFLVQASTASPWTPLGPWRGRHVSIELPPPRVCAV